MGYILMNLDVSWELLWNNCNYIEFFFWLRKSNLHVFIRLEFLCDIYIIRLFDYYWRKNFILNDISQSKDISIYKSQLCDQ